MHDGSVGESNMHTCSTKITRAYHKSIIPVGTVRPIHTAGARAVYRTCSVRQGLARMMPAARSTAVPCIERVLCPICLVCLCYRGQCIVHGAAAAPATPAATLGTHALVPLHPLETAAGCVRQGPLRMRTFCWRVCAFDFV